MKSIVLLQPVILPSLIFLLSRWTFKDLIRENRLWVLPDYVVTALHNMPLRTACSPALTNWPCMRRKRTLRLHENTDLSI
jgi:hypothetical protein